MKKYQLIGQPIYVGEIYNHNGDLYRVESFDEGYTEPKAVSYTHLDVYKRQG